MGDKAVKAENESDNSRDGERGKGEVLLLLLLLFFALLDAVSKLEGLLEEAVGALKVLFGAVNNVGTLLRFIIFQV